MASTASLPTPSASDSETDHTDAATDDTLRLAIVVCSSASLVSLVFSFIRHSMFSSSHQLSAASLLSFLTSLLMMQTMFVIGVSGIETGAGCRMVSLLLHSFHLAAFCWLLVMLHQACRRCLRCVSLTGGGPDSESVGQITRCCLFGWGLPLLCAGLHVALPAGSAPPTASRPSPLGCWAAAGRPRLLATFTAPALALTLGALALLARCAVLVRHAVAMQVVGRTRRRLRAACYRQLLRHGRLLLLLTLAAVSGTIAAGVDRQAARALHALLLACIGLLASACLGWRTQAQIDAWRRPWQAASYEAAAAARTSSMEVLTMSSPEVI